MHASLLNDCALAATLHFVWTFYILFCFLIAKCGALALLCDELSFLSTITDIVSFVLLCRVMKYSQCIYTEKLNVCREMQFVADMIRAASVSQCQLESVIWISGSHLTQTPS